MKRVFLVISAVLLIMLCSCGAEEPWSYAELNALTENFSDAMYCGDLAIVAGAPEYAETITKEDAEYKVYTVTPGEVIRGMDKAGQISLEAPVDENGETVLDGLNADAEHLIFAYRTGDTYLIFSPYCVTELDLQGKLIWDDPDTKVIENNYPFYDLEHIREALTEYLDGIEDDISPALIARLKAQIRAEVEADAPYGYFEDWNWEIQSFSYHAGLIEDSSFYNTRYAEYQGIKKLLYHTASWSHSLEEEDIAGFGSKGFLLYINTHSFSDAIAGFFYDFKTDTLIHY